MVYQVYEAVSIPVIGMGGVSTAEDVIEMMLAGAAAVEPVADRRIVNCLTDAAEGITMLFQTLFAGAVLFLLIFAVLLRATS